MTPLPEGLLPVDKPGGPTSHDIVAAVRRLTGQRRIGHAGTLDPMATGLLPLVLGRATRLVRFLHHSPKLYEGSFELGWTTLTDDVTGEVLEDRREQDLPSADRVLEVAAAFRGMVRQVPPAVSARKVEGRRLYRMARSGEPVQAPSREVEIGVFDPAPTDHPGLWTFRAEVSAGTYIRSMVRDLGRSLGCGGTLRSLRRLSIGPLDLDAAVPLDDISDDTTGSLERALVPLADMPLDLDDHRLADPLDVQRFLAGAPVWMQAGDDAVRTVRVLDGGGALLGVAEVLEDRLQPRVVIG